MATAILKATDIAATIDWYTSIGCEVGRRDPNGYFITFTEAVGDWS
jgi:hypothetical protein